MVTLKEARKAKGFLQKELAAMVGCSTSAIGMYEQGRREPKIALFKKLAKVLEVPLDDLEIKSHLPSGGQMAENE